MQFPTPLDCISNALFLPPAYAPHDKPTPSCSVVSVTTSISLSFSQRFIRGVCPASGT